MKNLKCFPFERNRYFYGKLLSVDDFETEQKYFNDKRRTVNRYLLGTGVVCGLHVVEVDDETVSVERGLALDFAGREIMVDEPVIRRISQFEGYDDGPEAGEAGAYYYLCLEYREEAAELMHNVAGPQEQNIGEYNKYRESYRLFVTQQEPEQEIFAPDQLYRERRVVYSGEGVCISQVLLRYLESGAETALQIEVEKTGRQQTISFEYELVLSSMTCMDETTVKVHFDEKDYPANRIYHMEIPLKAAYVNGAEAQAAVLPDSFCLRAGDREYRPKISAASRTSVSSRDSFEAMQEEYYKGAMDHIINHTFQQSIYLARIYVVKAGTACMIERVETLPFQQKILHSDISAAMIGKLTDDVQKLREKGTSGAEADRKAAPHEQAPRIASGEVVFDLADVKAGQTLLSEEITHGLGFARVAVILGYEAENTDAEGSETVFGDPGVFSEDPDISLGARVNAEEGSFVIGVKTRKETGKGRLKVFWTALRDEASKTLARRKRIFIRPDIPSLFAGQSIVFTAVLEGFEDDRFTWQVKDSAGGTIDRNGKYTAPESAGVYQVAVESAAYPEVKATTFVVVQERNND
ncbi:MAG: hypothetical protein LIO75_09795 [Lachnospiraceae bacterium]|nr:hypothetical protein [Lachnospiraceae bacterium]